MRIGIDATSLPVEPAGAGTYIIQLVRALAGINTDHELFVFVHRSRLVHFQDHQASRMHFVPVQDKSPALRLIWEQLALPGLANRYNLDLLHSLHYTRPTILSCLSIVTFHDMTFFMYPQLHTRSKRLLFPLFIRSSARRAKAIITVSETTRRDAIRILNIPEHKILAIPHGVSAEFFHITDHTVLEAGCKKYNLPEDFILFLGTIEPRKNLPSLLRAYHRLLESGCNYQLVLAGHEGWMMGELQDTIQKLKLGKFVHFTGYIPKDDLPVIYNSARIFVYPSLYEGFGLPPVEAMACGTPVVASDIPVNKDHVGDAGLLFPPDDEFQLFNHLDRLVKDRDLREDLSRKGIERSRAFRWQATAQSTLDLYQRAEAW